MKLENPAEAMCEGKAYFPTFERAKRKAKERRIGRPYHCQFCNGFHIGNTVAGKSFGKRPLPEISEADREDMEGRN